MQTPSQQTSPPSQSVPFPDGPTQHSESNDKPGKHSPPHFTRPSPQVLAQPVPFVMHRPSQHSEPWLQSTPWPSEPRQQTSSWTPAKHSPPHRTMPMAQCSEQAEPAATQSPSQQIADGPQSIPPPEGFRQHWSSKDPKRHSLPQCTSPGPQSVAQPVPFIMQMPPQHSAPAPQSIPLPESPRQHVLSSLPAMQRPPQGTVPSRQVTMPAMLITSCRTPSAGRCRAHAAPPLSWSQAWPNNSATAKHTPAKITPAKTSCLAVAARLRRRSRSPSVEL
mmetsp:Transcript_53087/g.153105  ORF Transcript_53087/g.153105 Transcript_53087/m.153105 type:complete len:277 (+) Transcript_53087:1029-1859(+)